jgi:hypothetical protein
MKRRPGKTRTSDVGRRLMVGRVRAALVFPHLTAADAGAGYYIDGQSLPSAGTSQYAHTEKGLDK